MVPWWRMFSNQFQDVSALGGVGGEECFTSLLQGVETDNIHRRNAIGKASRRRNVPFKDDETAHPERYVEEVVTGFRDMYKMLTDHWEELLEPGSPLKDLARAPMRLVFRDTSTYFAILRNSLDAPSLRDGSDRFISLEALSRVVLASEGKARFAPFLRVEKQALAQLDIPFFAVSAESRDVDFGENGIVKNCFPQAGYERVRARLASLGDLEMGQQIDVIRGSFWARAASQGRTVGKLEGPEIPSTELPQTTIDELVGQAAMIGQRLQREAVRGSDGSLTWIGIVSNTKAPTYRYGVLGAGLYDGLAGIALFLGALARTTGDRSFHQTASGALLSIRRSMSSYEDLLLRATPPRRLQTPTAGLSGLGAIVYAMTRFSELSGEPSGLDIATSTACLIGSKLLEATSELDVLEGQAGAILGLLTLQEACFDSSLLETSVAWGDNILEHLESSRQLETKPASLGAGVMAGFARGPSGVAHALLRLHSASQESRFLKAARELIPIAPEDHDWQTIEANWNNGAAGLGLSWIQNAWAMNDDRHGRNIDRAVNRCVEASLDAPDQVCHGIGGRLDLLIEASKFLGDSDHLLEVARKHAGWCIERAKRAGGFRLHSQLPAGATLHGFYEGSSGIGYQFLRLASPGSLPSVLLWN